MKPRGSRQTISLMELLNELPSSLGGNTITINTTVNANKRQLGTPNQTDL
jgi:hypothetical protein